MQVLEVHAGLVKRADFARFQAGADVAGLAAVVILGHVDDGARGQEALQVQPQVAFAAALRRRCLAQSIQLATS